MELLQNKLRPNKLKDVIGQSHLIGKDKILSNLVKNKKIFNMLKDNFGVTHHKMYILKNKEQDEA